MAPSTKPRMDSTDRTILDCFKEGVSLRTISLRVDVELTDVQAIVQDLAGGDRTRAAALVADYDKEHPTTPRTDDLVAESPVARRTPAPQPAKPARAKPPRVTPATPAAPTVVPVKLAETRAVDMPAETAVALPAPQTRPAITPTPAPPAPEDAATAERHALAGPTDALPYVDSFEELMAAVPTIDDPTMTALAGEVGDLVDRLHDAYARERQTRTIRAEAAALRRELDTRIALLTSALLRPEGGDTRG